MPRRIRQSARRWFRAALAAATLAAAAPLARAQDEYNPPVQMTEDEIALAFLLGRYTTPVTCKKTDGTVIELESSLAVKHAPESGGGNAVKLTFFGIDVADVAYCYNLVERRVVDRRGSILLHYRSHNRKDKGVSDFRRTMVRGDVTYHAHRGELRERGIGAEADPADSRTLSFDGGDSKLTVGMVTPGSDGAKLFAESDAREGGITVERNRFTFRFTAKDGSEFVFYGSEAGRRGK